MLARSEAVRDTGAHIYAFGEFHARSSHNEIVTNEISYRKGIEIYGEKEPAEYLYLATCGAIRSYKLLSDGRRQIGAFHLPGDIFGVESGAVHRFTTEAIIDSTVVLVTRSSLDYIATTDGQVIRKLLSLTASSLRHAEDHMLLLGRKTAMERVAAFLLEMDRRSAAAGLLALPMTRRDIADYLGLTLETVSRVLSHLHDDGILGFVDTTRRQIVLQDRRRLRLMDT